MGNQLTLQALTSISDILRMPLSTHRVNSSCHRSALLSTVRNDLMRDKIVKPEFRF